MQKNAFEAMIACLLHDYGKIVYRANVGSGNHSIRGAEYLKEYLPSEILTAIRYHHRSSLQSACVEDNDLAYIAYIADNISSAADRRSEAEGENERVFQKEAALESIFASIGKKKNDLTFAVDSINDEIQYPTKANRNDAAAYGHVLELFKEGLKGIAFEESYANSLIDLCMRCMAYVPSSTAAGERCDVSLFHHSKTTAAIGSCIRMYLDSIGETNFKQCLFNDEAAFMKKQAFVLYSIDMSGIQSFIYTISSKGALKGLRARSFYLSVFMEHIADRILEEVGLFRTNLIYVGGGKAHLLLPNTPTCLEKADTVIKNANSFLRERFGISLFLAAGKCTCSGNDLTSDGGKSDRFAQLFRITSAAISKAKLQRYSADELRFLNAPLTMDHDRECVICGNAGKLVKRGNDYICDTCARLEAFAASFTDTDMVLLVERENSPSALPLPEGMWLRPISERDARSKLNSAAETIVRLYGVNKTYSGLKMTTRLSVGNYAPTNAHGDRMSFEELAECSSGVRRLGVLRADVDNLGALFAHGFRDDKAANPWRFATLSRYTALSMALTDFFQRDINRIVRGQDEAPRNVSIVYAGGDDVFLIGAWNETLDAGLELKREFDRYTGGAVTLSAGFGMFKEHTPVAVMAATAADLEDDSKKMDDGRKNALSIFEIRRNRFRWETFESDILSAKYDLLDAVRQIEGENGNAFLYNVMHLLREIRPGTMAIARLAYTLARHAPREDSTTKQAYDVFSRKVYAWAMNPEENRKLQTAILYYVYRNRKEQDDHGV